MSNQQSPHQSAPDAAPETARQAVPVVVAMCTCPDEATAGSIAAALVNEGLATCINRISGLRSTYLWDGRLHDDQEILLLMKTTAPRLAAIEARLRQLHPYELPELLAIPAAGGNERYLDWVRQGVLHKGNSSEQS